MTVDTDETGQASSGPIEQGTYTVAVSKSGYYQERATVGVNEDTNRVISIDRGTVQATISVEDDHFDPPEAVANATVEIQPLGSSLVTLDDGETSTGLPINRNYEVTASKPGYDSTTTNLAVGEGDTTSLTVAISRTPDVNITTSSRRIVVGEPAHVTVTDEYGDPAADVPLSVNGTEVARTGDDGEADVRIDSAGNVTITATREGTEDSVTVEGVQTGGGDETTAANGTTAAATEGGIGPGFGPLAALVGVAFGAGLAARRR